MPRSSARKNNDAFCFVRNKNHHPTFNSWKPHRFARHLRRGKYSKNTVKNNPQLLHSNANYHVYEWAVWLLYEFCDPLQIPVQTTHCSYVRSLSLKNVLFAISNNHAFIIFPFVHSLDLATWSVMHWSVFGRYFGPWSLSNIHRFNSFRLLCTRRLSYIQFRFHKLFCFCDYFNFKHVK